MKTAFRAIQSHADESVLVFPVAKDKSLNMHPDLPSKLLNYALDALEFGDGFEGKRGETLTLRWQDRKVILVGTGDDQNLDARAARELAAPLYKALTAVKAKDVVIDASTLGGTKAKNALLTAELANALKVESYEFKQYKTLPGKAESRQPETVTFETANPQKAGKLFGALEKVTDSMFWASDLVNQPGNVLYPETYAEKIRTELEPLGVKVRVIDHEEMQRLGMNAAYAVGKGSAKPPRMVVMEYNGAEGAPLALVGKGITFDSGGISIKSASGMKEMTMDMGGSAAVVGAVRAAAARGAKTHLVAIAALAENMPDGNSYRPGDIVKTLNGKTVEIDNTDAEGRMVLSDAMTFIQREYKPHTVIDAATLTGAAVVALGTEFAAVYSNDEKLWKQFNSASAKSGEKIWRMPLLETKAFQNTMRNTPLADLTNSGGRWGGSATAAAFLHEFVEQDEKGKDKANWVHIDMAGPGIPDHSILKGWGVRLLDQLIHDHFEEKAKRAPKTPRKPSAKKHAETRIRTVFSS